MKFYRPELDVLRFLAFLFVFVSHALPRNPDLYVARGIPAAGWISAAVSAGANGVDLFFVLSAYLITEILLREHRERGTINIRSFLIRRVLRIWPLYFFFLGLCSFVLPHLLPNEHLGTGYLLAYTFLGGNWACAAWGYPSSAAAPLWSVSIEEQFYLSWPVLLSVFGFDRIRWLTTVLICASLATLIVLVSRAVTDEAIWCNTLIRAGSIGCGAALAIGLHGDVPRWRVGGRLLLAALGLMLWVISARVGRGLLLIVSYPAVTVGSLMMLLSVLGARLRNPVLRYLGTISYGLYVYHFFAVTLGMIFVARLGPRVVFSLGLTVLLASLSYHFLEQPFLRLKKRFTYIETRPAIEINYKF